MRNCRIGTPVISGAWSNLRMGAWRVAAATRRFAYGTGAERHSLAGRCCEATLTRSLRCRQWAGMSYGADPEIVQFGSGAVGGARFLAPRTSMLTRVRSCVLPNCTTGGWQAGAPTEPFVCGAGTANAKESLAALQPG